MISNPKEGDRVRLHYRRELRGMALYHGREGTVRIPGRGRPRNHLVDVGGALTAVPAGHLQKPEVRNG